MKSFAKKTLKGWKINNKLVEKEIKKNNISFDDYNAIRELIINNIINNATFLKFFIENVKINGYFHFNLDFSSQNLDTLLITKIDDEIIKNKLKNIKTLTKKQKLILEQIELYTSPNYVLQKNFHKKIENTDVSYQEILNFLIKSPEENNIKENQTFFNLSGYQLLEIIKKHPFSINILGIGLPLKKIGLSENDKNNIRKNYDKISYYYLENKLANEKFTPARSVIDQFELNANLEKSIMEEIPSEFNKLQKAYFIYKRLCQKFSYDEEYFYLQNYNMRENVSKDHSDINNLSKLENKQSVICTEISLIFAKFLDKLDIPFQILNYDNNYVDKLEYNHMKVRFKYKEYVIDADAADGLFQSDLVREKTRGKTYSFKTINGLQRIDDSFYKEIKIVDDYFEKYSDILEYKDAKSIYSSLISQNSLTLTNDERLMILEDIISTTNMKYFDLIELLNTAVKNIFPNKNCVIEFIVNLTETPKLNILIIYNNENNILNNYESNQYFVFSPGEPKQVFNYQELKNKFNKNIYDFTSPNRNILNLKEIGDTNEKRDHFSRN